MKNKKLIKMDINFLEYPNWTIAGRSDIKSLTIEKPHGTYHISTTEKADRLPDRVDKMILYYLLLQKKKNIQITRYRIAKDVFDAKKGGASSYYARVMLALERWMWMGIKFEGVFYEGDGYTKRGFHIIDSYKLEKKDKRGEELLIRINKDFFEQLEHSDFFKYIDFAEFKKLKKPISVRLYEILSKDFKGRDIRKIGIMLLAEKLTLNLKYPSHILNKVRVASREINQKTKLKFTMTYDKESRSCTFTLLKQESHPILIPVDSEEYKNLLLILPESLRRQKSVKELVAMYHSQKGYQYVYFNILYTLQNASRNKKAYLKKALEENYGEEIQAQMKGTAKQEKEKKRKEQLQKKREEMRERLRKQLERWVQKYGGFKKALYGGNLVLWPSPGPDGIIVKIDETRMELIPLEEIREEEFSSSK